MPVGGGNDSSRSSRNVPYRTPLTNLQLDGGGNLFETAACATANQFSC